MPRSNRKSILGRKVGMSQVYDTEGKRWPVTLIEAGPCTVLQVKSDPVDGYGALQVGFDDTRKRPAQPQEGIFKKAGTAAKRYVREIPVAFDPVPTVGATITIEVLQGVPSVDVSGTSKGKGFQGTVKRWNHRIGPKSHGSKSKRLMGSVGMHQDPGRILKGKKMPGHMGHEQVKVRNLKVISIDSEKNLLVVGGAVPGPNGGYLYIEESLH